MKITGYTILYSILTIVGLKFFYNIEKWMYFNWYVENKNQDIVLYFFINILLFLIIMFILGINGILNIIFYWLDKILKKRIL